MHRTRNAAAALLLAAVLLPFDVNAAGLRYVSTQADRDLQNHAYYCETKGALEALEAGANIDAMSSSGFTPLMTAALSECDELAQILIDRGANLTAENDSGKTALDIARLGAPNIVDALEAALGGGAQAAPGQGGKRTAPGKTAAHPAKLRYVSTKADRDLQNHAYYCETQGALEALEAGANIDAMDSSGFTPLMMAALSECDELAQILIDRGANLTAENDSGKTALDLAKLGAPNIVDALETALGGGEAVKPRTDAASEPQRGGNRTVSVTKVAAAGVSNGPPAGYYECYFYGFSGIQGSSMTSMNVLGEGRYEALGDAGNFTYDAGSNTLNLAGGGLAGLVAHIEQSDGKPAIVFIRKENERGGTPAIDISDTWCYFEPR
jgi:hypothetical protein